MDDLIVCSFKGQILRIQFSAKGKPFFCLTDICEILEVTDFDSLAASIKEEFEIPHLILRGIKKETGVCGAIFITESQLYYVLMCFKTKKIKPFRQWVLNEVLPAIHKQSYYILKESKKDTLLRKLEFLKLSLTTENITEEQHAKMLNELCEEYTNS